MWGRREEGRRGKEFTPNEQSVQKALRSFKEMVGWGMKDRDVGSARGRGRESEDTWFIVKQRLEELQKDHFFKGIHCKPQQCLFILNVKGSNK